MVAKQHEVARMLVRRQAAACVGDDEGVRAQHAKRPDGQHNLAWGVAFVQMEAPLHSGDGYAAQPPKHQPSRMSDNRRAREMWYLGVGYGCRRIDTLGYAT